MQRRLKIEKWPTMKRGKSEKKEGKKPQDLADLEPEDGAFSAPEDVVKRAGRNPNHPKRGSHISVDPIRDLKDIESIKRMLSSKPRDLLLFTAGINNGLRTGDLLKLKVGDVRHLKEGETLNIIESKTKKQNFFMVNKPIFKALKNYIQKVNPDEGDYLFPSARTGEPISIPAVNLMIKKWTKAINLKGNFGTHSLRKTFGYVQRVKYGVGIEVLMKRFNHSSPAVTLRYLGVNDEEVNGILLNEI